MRVVCPMTKSLHNWPSFSFNLFVYIITYPFEPAPPLSSQGTNPLFFTGQRRSWNIPSGEGDLSSLPNILCISPSFSRRSTLLGLQLRLPHPHYAGSQWHIIFCIGLILLLHPYGGFSNAWPLTCKSVKLKDRHIDTPHVVPGRRSGNKHTKKETATSTSSVSNLLF